MILSPRKPSLFHSFTSVEVFREVVFFPTGVLEPLPLGQNDSGPRPRRPRWAPPRGLQPLGRREEAGGRPAAQRQLPLRTDSQRLPGEGPKTEVKEVRRCRVEPSSNRPCSSVPAAHTTALLRCRVVHGQPGGAPAGRPGPAGIGPEHRGGVHLRPRSVPTAEST